MFPDRGDDTHANEACGKPMKQEASDEFLGCEIHDFHASIVSIVAITEADAIVLESSARGRRRVRHR